MLSINENTITIQLQREKPEQFVIGLSKAITETVKLVIESEEILQDAEIPDHIIFLLDLQEALQLDEIQLKAASKIEPKSNEQ